MCGGQGLCLSELGLQAGAAASTAMCSESQGHPLSLAQPGHFCVPSAVWAQASQVCVLEGDGEVTPPMPVAVLCPQQKGSEGLSCV